MNSVCFWFGTMRWEFNIYQHTELEYLLSAILFETIENCWDLCAIKSWPRYCCHAPLIHPWCVHTHRRRYNASPTINAERLRHFSHERICFGTMRLEFSICLQSSPWNIFCFSSSSKMSKLIVSAQQKVGHVTTVCDPSTLFTHASLCIQSFAFCSQNRKTAALLQLRMLQLPWFGLIWAEHVPEKKRGSLKTCAWRRLELTIFQQTSPLRHLLSRIQREDVESFSNVCATRSKSARHVLGMWLMLCTDASM